MKNETVNKIIKWGVGLTLGALATYGIYVAWNHNKSSGPVDTTGMIKYQIVMPFAYQGLVGNIYDMLLNYKYADVGEVVINDAANNPATIVLTIMALPDDATAIQNDLQTINPDIKFSVLTTDQKSINN